MLQLISYEKVLGLTHSMETCYLSLSAQVALGTFFIESQVQAALIVDSEYICHTLLRLTKC